MLRARKSTSSNEEVEKRVGRNGKARCQPTKSADRKDKIPPEKMDAIGEAYLAGDKTRKQIAAAAGDSSAGRLNVPSS